MASTGTSVPVAALFFVPSTFTTMVWLPGASPLTERPTTCQAVLGWYRSTVVAGPPSTLTDALP